MLKRGGYAKDFSQRLGMIPALPPKLPETKRVWIQAVSVGEAQAIRPLVTQLNKDPHVEVVITTTTSTAYKILEEQYADKVKQVGIFPIDFWPFSSACWDHINPDVSILMESELWPEHLNQAKKRKVPILLINARMSDRSFHRYKKISGIARCLIKKPTRILAATSQDKERFEVMGAQPENIVLTGNIKFDAVIDPILTEHERNALKEDLGLESAFKETRAPSNPPLIILGSSTWPNEEQFLIEVFEEVLKKGINCRLLLVPRHAERRDEIVALLEKQDRAWHVRTRGNPEGPVRIYLADTTGELSFLSQIADVAFIGKTLLPNVEGQTPIEAAALGIPMLYGPGTSNFKQICHSLEKAEAAIRCEDEPSLKKEMFRLLQHQNVRKRMSAAAKQWHELNQGATQKTVNTIIEVLNNKG